MYTLLFIYLVIYKTLKLLHESTVQELYSTFWFKLIYVYSFQLPTKNGRIIMNTKQLSFTYLVMEPCEESAIFLI
jgi:hypothetical protein